MSCATVGTTLADTLTEWLESFIPGRYKNPNAFARVLGWSLTTFNRGRRGGTFEIENLLHLAHVTGEDATRVLTLGGKGDLAKLIVRAYGPARPSESPAVRDLVGQLEAIPDRNIRDQVAQTMAMMLQALAAGASGQTAISVAAAPPAPTEVTGDTRHTRADRSRGVRRAAGKG